MQLEVQNYELPSAIQFNYDELKTALTAKCHEYEVMVYTDDQIKQAKSDRASLNKLKKALTEERIRREKEYMVPFNEFKDKISEIISIIDKPASIIDARVKEYEQQKKDEKKALIEEEFKKVGFPEYITLEKIWDDTWLNSSCSLSRIKEDFKTLAYRDGKNIDTLSHLPEFSFEAIEIYKDCLDVSLTMDKVNDLARLARAKQAVAEEKKQDEIPFTAMPEPVEVVEVVPEEEERYWLQFKAYLSVKEAQELNAFLTYNKIQFELVKGE